MADLKQLKHEIVEKIEDYLAGRLDVHELRSWAAEAQDRWDVDEFVEGPRSIDFYIVEDGIWTIRFFEDVEEPEEYRSTREDLVTVLHYLTGEAPFPRSRIAPDNLTTLRESMAGKIDEYLGGWLEADALARWADFQMELVDRLDLAGTPGYSVLKDAVTVICRLGRDKPKALGPSRKELQLAVWYLRGQIYRRQDYES